MTRQDTNFPTATSLQPDTNNPAPAFSIGAEVEVIVNERNRTYHRGIIASAIWHHKAKTWHYRLAANGKKISKRYEACDLRPVL